MGAVRPGRSLWLTLTGVVHPTLSRELRWLSGPGDALAQAVLPETQ
jgi:hypothetical protein